MKFLSLSSISPSAERESAAGRGAHWHCRSITHWVVATETQDICYCKHVLLKCECNSLKQQVPECPARYLWSCYQTAVPFRSLHARHAILGSVHRLIKYIYWLEGAGYSLNLAGHLNGSWQGQESEWMCLADGSACKLAYICSEEANTQVLPLLLNKNTELSQHWLTSLWRRLNGYF